METVKEQKPRYTLRKTWFDKEDDFVCEVDGKSVARMYLHHSGVWTWFMNASWLSSVTGASDTPLEAACAAEDAYDRAVEIEALRRSSLDVK